MGFDDLPGDCQAKAAASLGAGLIAHCERGEQILAQGFRNAVAIVRQAQNEAEMEKRKAQATIRREITDVSAALTEKLIGRELKEADHRELIDSFLQEIGDDHDANE